ncbi:MAG TPA: VanZ family protein [Xanthomonadales bacterium]|nr:VanZ family protein [Xanthomonadales bacterium]
MIRGTVAIVKQVVRRQPRLLAGVALGTIAIALSLLWPMDLGDGHSVLVNVAHVPAFFMATLLWVVLFDRAGVSFWLTCAAALLLCGGLALATEVAQYFVPYRWPDARDLVLDLVGVFAALLVYGAWTWRLKERDA